MAVVPEQLVENELKSGRLKLINATGRELTNQITLTRRLERPTTAREKIFIDFYKNYSSRVSKE